VSTALVTGFPGFIGRRLVRTLAADHPELRIVALVEARMEATARELAGQISDRVEVIAGDITQPQLGMPAADHERLTGEVAHVFHLAAIYDLAVPEQVARLVNVEGTRNVLDFCEACERLERLAYVSTAYVAGTRTGVVLESELDAGQGHKNHYESTKYEAEVLVRARMDRIPTTILRPAIVVGDSRTGETEKFDGPYYLLRVISRFRRMHLPIVRFGASEAPFNVVPVDYVVAAIAAATFVAEAEGETLHLVDSEPLTTRELMTELGREYAGREPRGRVPAGFGTSLLRFKWGRRLYGGAPRESIAYLNHPVRFDTTRSVALLSSLGLAPPRFTDYVDAMVAFFRDHEDDPAFQQKV
jgi:thioester reductase-like protein